MVFIKGHYFIKLSKMIGVMASRRY